MANPNIVTQANEIAGQHIENLIDRSTRTLGIAVIVIANNHQSPDLLAYFDAANAMAAELYSLHTFGQDSATK